MQRTPSLSQIINKVCHFQLCYWLKKSFLASSRGSLILECFLPHPCLHAAILDYYHQSCVARLQHGGGCGLDRAVASYKCFVMLSSPGRDWMDRGELISGPNRFGINPFQIPLNPHGDGLTQQGLMHLKYKLWCEGDNQDWTRTQVRYDFKWCKLIMIENPFSLIKKISYMKGWNWQKYFF